MFILIFKHLVSYTLDIELTPRMRLEKNLTTSPPAPPSYPQRETLNIDDLK